MNSASTERLLQHIRRLAGEPPDTSDGELLRRYRESKDQAAFAALMRRHGPMVFSVCQAVLRRREDAEDAFQATFLILAQQAGSIRSHDDLSGWLQRVAYHVALKARADNAKRSKREAKAARALLRSCLSSSRRTITLHYRVEKCIHRRGMEQGQGMASPWNDHLGSRPFARQGAIRRTVDLEDRHAARLGAGTPFRHRTQRPSDESGFRLRKSLQPPERPLSQETSTKSRRTVGCASESIRS
jgi:RNA polymerase sigma factor (sigma-70 family)